MVILTLDVGLTNTKIAKVNNNFELVQTREQRSEPEKIEDLIVEVAKEGDDIDKIALAVTHAVSTDRKFIFDSGKRAYVEIERLSNALGCPVFPYNDSDATGFVLNIPREESVIQEGNPEGRPNVKLLFYLGTGFTVNTCVPSSYGYQPIYVPGTRHHLPDNVLDDKLYQAIMDKVKPSNGSLRTKDVVPAKGLENIHFAVTGQITTTRQIIDNAEKNQETLQVYSSALGKALRNLVSGHAAYGGVHIGGTFASVIAPHLDRKRFLQAFAADDFKGDVDPKRAFDSLYLSIPIKIITERYATNRGAAFAAHNGLQTTANLFKYDL